jgi:hypothetical protein
MNMPTNAGEGVLFHVFHMNGWHTRRGNMLQHLAGVG